MVIKNLFMSGVILSLSATLSWGSAADQQGDLEAGLLPGPAGAAGGGGAPVVPAPQGGLTDNDIANLVRYQMGLPAGAVVFLNQGDADRARQAYALTVTNRMFVEEVNTLARWLRIDEWSSMGLHLAAAVTGAGGVIVSSLASSDYIATTFSPETAGILQISATAVFTTITALNAIGAYMAGAAKGRRGQLAERNVATVAQAPGVGLPVLQVQAGGGGVQVAQQ